MKNLFHTVSRFGSSTFLLFVVALLLIEVGVAAFSPVERLEGNKLARVHQNAVVAKLPKIMASPESKDVLLLGSSLVQVSTVRCDDKFNGIPSRWDGWYFRYYINGYDKADYLESLLSKRLGEPTTVCNAAISASVMSDQYLIASKYLAHGKRPKLAIVTLAPRELLDNNRMKIAETPTAKALAESLPELLSQHADNGRIGNFVVAKASNFWRSRTEVKDFLLASTSALTERPINKDEQPVVTSTSKYYPKMMYPLYGQPPNMVYDLPGYKGMYLPLNRKQWAQQTDAFRKLLALLKDNGVPTVVVDVPVSAENYALLPPGFVDEYKTFVAQEAAKYGATLVRPADTNTFATKVDFEDSAHMNASGGEKLYNAVADAIAAQPNLVAALTTNRRALAQNGAKAQ